MTRLQKPRRAALALVAAATLALSACGSDTLDSGSSEESPAAGNSPSAASSVSVDQELADRVPAKYKGQTLAVGTDASYAPNEFTAEDGRTIVGMDIDLMNAVSAKLGLETQVSNASFSSLLLGVSSGKYQASISSFTINPERMQQVNMVSYFNAGTQWAVAADNPKDVNPDEACGLNVGVQEGTVQIDDLTARSKECTDAGQPAINQVVQEEQSAVTASLVSGKVDAMAADSPVTLYAIQQSDGALEELGSIYDSAPYGIVVPKAETEMAEVIKEALEVLRTDGTYEEILDKWGNSSGAIDSFEVNPSTS